MMHIYSVVLNFQIQRARSVFGKGSAISCSAVQVRLLKMSKGRVERARSTPALLVTCPSAPTSKQKRQFQPGMQEQRCAQPASRILMELGTLSFLLLDSEAAYKRDWKVLLKALLVKHSHAFRLLTNTPLALSTQRIISEI